MNAYPPLEEVVPGLHASPPLRLPFGRDLRARAYVLERERGNVLVYGAAALEPHLAEVEALGGLTRQYLNHSHEATPEADIVAQRFGAPLFVHAGRQRRHSAHGHGPRDLRPSPPPRRRPRDHPDPGPHAGGRRIPVGHRRAPRPVHRRQPLPARRRLARRAPGRRQRPEHLHREPGAAARAGLRPPRARDRQRRRAGPRLHRLRGRPERIDAVVARLRAGGDH